MGDNPKVNSPASGDYGEGADLARLKQSLPQGQPVAGQQAPPPVPSGQIMPQPSVMGRPVTSAAVPPGIPSVIAAPTQRPDVPVHTPLDVTQPPMPAAATAEQGRVQFLMMLANDPTNSPATREWAGHVLSLLVGGNGQVLG